MGNFAIGSGGSVRNGRGSYKNPLGEGRIDGEEKGITRKRDLSPLKILLDRFFERKGVFFLFYTGCRE
ncbi:MAG: hypothetical protein ACP5Q4_00300 [Candidatus Caldatribacteriaceae bacterium]